MSTNTSTLSVNRLKGYYRLCSDVVLATAAGDITKTYRGKGWDVCSRMIATDNLVDTSTTTYRFRLECLAPCEEYAKVGHATWRDHCNMSSTDNCTYCICTGRPPLILKRFPHFGSTAVRGEFTASHPAPRSKTSLSADCSLVQVHRYWIPLMGWLNVWHNVI